MDDTGAEIAERRAHDERMHGIASLYKVYLDDAWAHDDWDKVAHWAEHLHKCLRSQWHPADTSPLTLPPRVHREITLD